MSTRAYHERLTAPLRWWVQTTMLLATIWLALVVSTPAWLAWTTTGACAAVAYGVVAWISWPVVAVVDGVLHAGRAHIPTELLEAPEPLDATATRAALGVQADARAYLMTRPYLKRAVRVTVVDPADPTPYWLVSTRHPERLAAAISP